MSSHNFAAPTKATVLDAMMSDLGNHRIEELARDSDRQSGREPAPPSHVSGAKKLSQPRNGAAHRNYLAQRWNAAVADGFHDDDAAGVSGLDPLDNGNAHRLSSGQFRSDKNRHNMSPLYDPSNPTFRKRSPKVYSNMGRSPARITRHPSTPNGSHRVSPLGGLVPDGGEVRRWDSGRQLSGTHHIHNPIQNLPAGRGRPVSSQRSSPSGQPAQPRLPIEPPSYDTSWVPSHLHGRRSSGSEDDLISFSPERDRKPAQSNQNTRIILKPPVLLALRTEKEACPEAVAQLNTVIKGPEPPASPVLRPLKGLMASRWAFV